MASNLKVNTMPMTRTPMMRTSFRKASLEDIREFICRRRVDRERVFKTHHNKTIKSTIRVDNEDIIEIDDESKLPIGVLYNKYGSDYAMGVCNKLGQYHIDTAFTVEIIKRIKYTMWGPYQRTNWTVKEIEENIIWRSRLIDKPKQIDYRSVPQFERSRWMIFCFWTGDIEDLISIELKLMDDILEQDTMYGGVMRRNIPGIYGYTTLEQLKEHLKKQYRETKFSLNEEEINFVNNQGWFGWKVKAIMNKK